MVICGPPSYCDRRKNIIDNPVVIVEVLSPSTESYDRGDEFDAYKQPRGARIGKRIAVEPPSVI